jgi:hypothetical protein
MASYYVNKNKQTNGDREVHRDDCQWLPNTQNRLYLGEYNHCADAVREANRHYPQVNGCATCSAQCHTG